MRTPLSLTSSALTTEPVDLPLDLVATPGASIAAHPTCQWRAERASFNFQGFWLSNLPAQAIFMFLERVPLWVTDVRLSHYLLSALTTECSCGSGFAQVPFWRLASTSTSCVNNVAKAIHGVTKSNLLESRDAEVLPAGLGELPNASLVLNHRSASRSIARCRWACEKPQAAAGTARTQCQRLLGLQPFGIRALGKLRLSRSDQQKPNQTHSTKPGSTQ